MVLTWSDRFDRPMTDVFEMQDDMAGAITTALKGRLSVARPRARQYVPNIDSCESYLSGRTHLKPLRDHHRWPDLAARMKLPAMAT